MCWRVKSAAVAIAIVGVAMPCVHAFATTLELALAYTYANNPQLNAQRALVRATDEGVPQALAGYRPKASVTASAGMQSLSTTIREIGSTTAADGAAELFHAKRTQLPARLSARPLRKPC